MLLLLRGAIYIKIQVEACSRRVELEFGGNGMELEMEMGGAGSVDTQVASFLPST